MSQMLTALAAMLGDPGMPPAGRLAYRVTDLPPEGRQLLLRRSDGAFVLALWREAYLWDRDRHQSVALAPITVTVTFGAGVRSIQRFDVLPGGGAPREVPLRANLARNNLRAVEVRQAAVIPGHESREVILNLPEEGRDMMVGAHLTEHVEVSGRSTRSHLAVQGPPFRYLAQGRDLIKIDAEGIEAALLADIRDIIVSFRPTLLVEVLPEATQLGELLAELAAKADYIIHVIPEYGSDTIVTVAPAAFTSATPARYRSKDVVLSVQSLV